MDFELLWCEKRKTMPRWDHSIPEMEICIWQRQCVVEQRSWQTHLQMKCCVCSCAECMLHDTARERCHTRNRIRSNGELNIVRCIFKRHKTQDWNGKGFYPTSTSPTSSLIDEGVCVCVCFSFPIKNGVSLPSGFLLRFFCVRASHIRIFIKTRFRHISMLIFSVRSNSNTKWFIRSTCCGCESIKMSTTK